MKISVIVKPNARRETVKLLPNGTLQLHVNAPPVEGRANEAAIRLMAHYYDVPPSAVSIVSGASSRRKRVEIAGK